MSSGDGEREFYQDRLPPEGGANRSGERQPDEYEAERFLHQRNSSGTSGDSKRLIGIPSIVVGVFVVGAIANGFINRDSSTEAVKAEDSPQAVLDAYIQASLSANDDHAAAALTCRAPHLDSVRSWQLDLATRRRQLGLPPIQADVASYAETRTAETVTAAVTVAVTATVGGQPQSRHTASYTFTLIHEDGWKVCTATPAN